MTINISFISNYHFL